MESELLHTYSKVDPFDVLILCVRVAVLIAVTLTVPIVLFPVSQQTGYGASGREGLLGATGLMALSTCPGTTRHPADAVSEPGVQLVAARAHRHWPAYLHQPAGYLRPQHPGHLWDHW